MKLIIQAVVYGGRFIYEMYATCFVSLFRNVAPGKHRVCAASVYDIGGSCSSLEQWSLFLWQFFLPFALLLRRVRKYN